MFVFAYVGRTSWVWRFMFLRDGVVSKYRKVEESGFQKQLTLKQHP